MLTFESKSTLIILTLVGVRDDDNLHVVIFQIKWKSKITLNSPKSNSQIIERGELDTPDIKIYDRSFSCLGFQLKVAHLKYFYGHQTLYMT